MRIGGRKNYGGGETVVRVWIFQVLLLGSVVLGNHFRGHQIAGGFGHGGQDSFQFPGAREPDRLLLDGYEVSRFGKSWSVHHSRQGSRERTTISTGISIRSRYFIYELLSFFHAVDKC
jgi:hypothetical protein